MSTNLCPYCHKEVPSALFKAHVANHQQIMPDGQQRDYVTLPPEERVSQDLADVPSVYIHQECGVATQMPEEIIRSYLKNPFLYMANTTFCCGCGKQVPYSKCNWSETGEELQAYFDRLRAQSTSANVRPTSQPALSSQANDSEPSSSRSFSIIAVIVGVASILFFTALKKLPVAAIKEAAKDNARQQNQNQNGKNGTINIRKMIEAGEDVPEALLVLAGIKPEEYQSIREELKYSKFDREFTLLCMQGNHSKALEYIDSKLDEFPDAFPLHNSKAWFLATCRDEETRDGKKAVEHALKACELKPDSATYVDTLAAAYAEDGNFDEAVKHIDRAIELTKDSAQKMRFEARRSLYLDHESYHD